MSQTGDVVARPNNNTDDFALVHREGNRGAFSDEELAAIETIQDAFDLFQEDETGLEDINEYGTGFAVLGANEKQRLVGQPFVILEWRFNEGEYARPFVSAALVTKAGEKLVLNDGSTGIASQLAAVTKKRIAKGHKRPQAGLKCERGLSVSEYKFTDEDGKDKPAKTFYLAE